MATAILARFPMGTYQAHLANGQPDPYPDVARLFSALVSAAGSGSTACVSGGRTALTEAARDALHWLEENPPTGLMLPQRTSPQSSVTSYRNEGTTERANAQQRATAALRLRTAGKPVGNVVSLNGPVAWIWDAEIPDGVHSVLDSLCADVAYLGESDSPVVLELAYAQPTHRVDPAATAFAIGGEWVRAPRAGRLEELDQAHDEAYPVRTPSIAKDAHAQGELTAPPPLTKSAALVRRRYASVDARPVAAPWRHAWALRLAVPIPQDSVVPMCVAVHRALVARIAEPAPSVVTGRYGEGQMRPPNRLAIHYVDPSLAPLLADPQLIGGAGAILVAFPADTETESQTAVERAVAGIRRLYHRDFAVAVTGMSGADATGLWEAPVPGMVRLWTSVTPLVAETRPQPGTWSLADAAALSVAFVARDALDLALDPALGRGEQRYRALVQAAKARGVRVGSTVPVHDSHVERYAHRLPESVVAQPYRAIATLGDLWNPQAFVALGQSRHLGGGFMAPMDVPAAVAAALTGGRQ